VAGLFAPAHDRGDQVFGLLLSRDLIGWCSSRLPRGVRLRPCLGIGRGAHGCCLRFAQTAVLVFLA
jgi:hypothetical protein